MSGHDYLFWALFAVGVVGLVGLLVILSDKACATLFGPADCLPQPTRRCDMRLVEQQTRHLSNAAPTAYELVAARYAKEQAVRTQAVNAAFEDTGKAVHCPRPCPYKPGSRAAQVWQQTYDRVTGDIIAARVHAGLDSAA
jgi:hypothetical protein